MFRLLSKFVEFTGNIIKYGCITHCIFEYFGDFVVCSGPSMEPTLSSDNILLTERISPRLSKICRGDIIIAKCPTNPSQHICKRVAGLPGDRFVTVEGSCGRLIDEMIVSTEGGDDNILNRSNSGVRTFETYVPKGQLWLVGDNVANSSDSRFYGPVPKGLIKSRVLCRLWPLGQARLLT